MIPRRYGYVPTPYNPQPALSQEEFHQLRIRRGFLAEKITREKLSLIELDNEYLFLNAQSIPFTQSTPDAETQAALIEIKDMSALAGPNNKENKILVQAVRHSLVAKKKGLFSVLIVGYKTEVTHSIRAIYDFIIRAPLLGAPIADFHPDHYSDDTDLGAVGGEGNSYLYDSHYQEEYIIEPRGCCPVVVNQQDCIHFLHGRRPMPYPLRTEDIIPGPSHNTLVELLNTLLHLVPDVRDDQHSSTSTTEQIHILESPNTRLHNNNPFSQPTPPLPHDYLTPVAFEFTENILQQSLENMVIEEIEDNPDEDEDEDEDEIEEVLSTTQPDIDKAKIKTEEDEEIDSTTIQSLPSTHTRKERQVARKAARQAQQEKMRAERQKHLDKQAKSKENKDKKKKNPGEGCSRAITNPSYLHYTELLEAHLSSILSQQQTSIDNRESHHTTSQSTLLNRELYSEIGESIPLNPSGTHQEERGSEANSDHIREESNEEVPTTIVPISKEEKEKIKQWIKTTFSYHLRPKEWESLFILLSEEGISTAEEMSALHNIALMSDRLKIVIQRLFQVLGHSFLPDITLAWLSATCPQLTPMMLLGGSYFSDTTFIRTINPLGLTTTAVRSFFSLFTTLSEYSLQEYIEPRYHDQHRSSNGLSTFGRMHHVLNNASAALSNSIDDYSTQQNAVLSQFQQRFHSPLNIDEESLRDLAISFTREGPSSQTVLENLLKRAAHATTGSLTLMKDGIDYRSNIGTGDTENHLFHFINRFLLGIRYRMITGANSIDELLKKLQDNSIFQWRVNHGNPEERKYYLKLISIASYLNQQNHPEECQWSDFLSSLNNAHPLEHQPIAARLSNNTMQSLASADRYSEADAGLLTALLFDGGKLTEAFDINNPELNHHGRAFQEIADETPFRLPESIPYIPIGLSSLSVLLTSLISDMALDNEITQQGLGHPIWINPHNAEQTREAIRSLQGRPHQYVREESYHLEAPSTTELINTIVYRLLTEHIALFSHTLAMVFFPIIHIREIFSTLLSLHQAYHSNPVRREEEEEEAEEIVITPSRKPSSGSTLRKRHRKK